MKKIALFLLSFAVFTSCKDQDASPAISGTFNGPITIEDKVGIASYSNADVSVKQLSETSVEISCRQFDSFVINDVARNGGSYYSAGDGDNQFRYSGSSSPKTLLIDWTTKRNGQWRTIRFGGNLKK